MLHQARLINDAIHAINEVIDKVKALNDEEKKAKILAVAPEWLKGRVQS